MKISGVDIRPGMVLEHQKKLWRVTKIQHTQPGKGGAFMMVEMKAILEGTKLNERFRSADTVEKAHLETRSMQYLYNEGETLALMDLTNYEQTSISTDLLGDQLPWLQENMQVEVAFHGENPVTIQIPEKVELEIIEADGVVKGQTASSSYKPAKLENGQTILVPPYIESGTRVIVNTFDGTFAARA